MSKLIKLNEDKKHKIENNIKEILLKDENIIFAYIYGSFVNEDLFRDIDIGIYLKDIEEKKVFDYEFEISYEISEKLNIDIEIVDVRVLNFAPFNFLNSVFRTGKPLFSRDEVFLTDLIEKVSLFAIYNEHISNLSLKELLDK